MIEAGRSHIQIINRRPSAMHSSCREQHAFSIPQQGVLICWCSSPCIASSRDSDAAPCHRTSWAFSSELFSPAYIHMHISETATIQLLPLDSTANLPGTIALPSSCHETEVHPPANAHDTTNDDPLFHRDNGKVEKRNQWPEFEPIGCDRPEIFLNVGHNG